VLNYNVDFISHLHMSQLEKLKLRLEQVLLLKGSPKEDNDIHIMGQDWK
jgi:hypothetical protein